MSETIFYEVHNGLYVNLTNRCPCSCTFCLRQNRDHMADSEPLWLDHEPAFEEVKEALSKFDLNKYEEVVFCGFGEPTEALDVLLQTAAFIKEKYGKKIRINTNGLGNLVNEKDVPPLLKGLVDTVSISLNTPDPEDYLKIVRPKFGKGSWQAMIDFAAECTKYVPEVVMTTVATTITPGQEEECRRICESIGVRYRIRAWEA